MPSDATAQSWSKSMASYPPHPGQPPPPPPLGMDIDFFNCCYARSYWYSYCAHNIDEAVKKILDSTDKYCYHYYEKNDSLKNKLENRLGDILVDDYVVTSNSENINLIKHVMRISNKYAKIGFEFNSNNISTESFTKKYRIQYFERDELELTTIEQIKSNKISLIVM